MELQVIQSRIFEVRGYRVIIDYHLAELYQVETRVLKQSVRRNLDRFPSDFMFQLTKEEANQLINIGVSQNVIPSNYNFGATLPFAFTEQGVAMLSSVLKSPIAIKINISIMRTFVAIRQIASGYEELINRIDELESSTDAQFNEIYQALTQLLSKPESNNSSPRKRIGYIRDEE